MRCHLVAIVVSLVVAGCSSSPPTVSRDLAERYVRLWLALGVHDPVSVDAYYGPPEWRTEAERARLSLAEIRSQAGELLARAKQVPAAGTSLEAQRARFFVAHTDALLARLDMLGGKKLPFDDESRVLYGAVAPTVSDARIKEIHARLERLVPGTGPLPARVEAFSSAFVVPRERVDAVFTAAIAECRARTLRHVQLPASESFTVEYVKDKPWVAYNWYKGNYRSVIQINTDLPFAIEHAVALACHEGYPGHHVYNSLIEKELVRGRGFSELSIYPLFSPTSLIAEGTADHGVDLAFPGTEMAEFSRRALFPLAGLDPASGASYFEMVDLLRELDGALAQGARRYVDGELDAAGAAAFSIGQRLYNPDRAKKFVDFIDANRSYVITYGVGRLLVRDHLDRRAGTGAGAAERRWSAFVHILSTPTLAADLAP